MPRCAFAARFCWTCGGNADHPDHLVRCAVARAYRIGVRRSHTAHRTGRTHRFGWTPARDTERHVDGMGAVAEWHVAQALGRPWLSDGDDPDPPTAGDVAGGVSVRWTPRPAGCLIVHEDEPASLVAVLVVNPTWPLRIAGWLPIPLAQQARWWRTNVRHPAFFVPQAVLRPLEALR